LGANATDLQYKNCGFAAYLLRQKVYCMENKDVYMKPLDPETKRRINAILSATRVVIATEGAIAHKKRTGRKLKISQRKNVSAFRIFLAYMGSKELFVNSFSRRLHISKKKVLETPEYLEIRPMINEFFEVNYPITPKTQKATDILDAQKKAWKAFLNDENTCRIARIRSLISTDILNKYKKVRKSLLDTFMNMLLVDEDRLIEFYQRQTSKELKALVSSVLYCYHQEQIMAYYYKYSPYGEYNIQRQIKKIAARPFSDESEYIMDCWRTACDTVNLKVGSLVTVFEVIYLRDCYDRMQKDFAMKNAAKKEIAKMRAERKKGAKVKDILKNEDEILEEMTKVKEYSFEAPYMDDSLSELDQQATLCENKRIIEEVRAKIIVASLQTALNLRIKQSTNKKDRNKYEKCKKLVSYFSDDTAKDVFKTWMLARDTGDDYTNKTLAKLMDVDESYIPNLYREVKKVVSQDLDFNAINREVHMGLFMFTEDGFAQVQKMLRQQEQEDLENFLGAISFVCHELLPKEHVVL